MASSFLFEVYGIKNKYLIRKKNHKCKSQLVALKIDNSLLVHKELLAKSNKTFSEITFVIKSASKIIIISHRNTYNYESFLIALRRSFTMKSKISLRVHMRK